MTHTTLKTAIEVQTYSASPIYLHL